MQMPTASNNNEARNDLAYQPLQKVYFSHSGYAKGAKETPVKRVLEKNPTRVLELAVKRMLDENKLRAPRMKRLRLFAGEEHSFTERFGK